MTEECDWQIRNVRLATMADNGNAYGAIEDGAIAIRGDSILYAGPQSGLPQLAARETLDVQGCWAAPGLVDCHTHLVYGGNRAQEFELRLRGASYEEIARQGGGILSTVAATRAASQATLQSSATKRLLRLLEEGITTVEIKSGYGLSLASELKMLRTARSLGDALPVSVRTTFLGAHTLPPEYEDADAYIDAICSEMLPEVARQGLADAVDVFCEGIAFTPAQCQRIFDQSRALGLPVKAHVEQLSNLGGARLAANYNALSVDHIEYLPAADVAALARAGTVATLLPGAYYFLGETQLPPIDALREANVPMAVSTDLNPGTSPMASLLTAMNQACVLFRLTPEEALRGATVNAARALGLADRGMLLPGMRADITIWEINHPAELTYGLNFQRPATVFHGGQLRPPLTTPFPEPQS